MTDKMQIAARTHPKRWKPGTADEAWKVIVCARDAYDTELLLSSLVYILTDAGADTARGLDLIRRMSGADIIAALEANIECSRQTVENAIRAEAV